MLVIAVVLIVAGTTTPGPRARPDRQVPGFCPAVTAALGTRVLRMLDTSWKQITVDTYRHLIPGANRKAVNALDDPEWNVDATHNMKAIDTTEKTAILAK